MSAGFCGSERIRRGRRSALAGAARPPRAPEGAPCWPEPITGGVRGTRCARSGSSRDRRLANGEGRACHGRLGGAAVLVAERARFEAWRPGCGRYMCVAGAEVLTTVT